MYAEKDDLLQFVLTKRNIAPHEIRYCFVICPYDIEEDEQTVEVDLQTEYKTHFERDFHRFNVVHSENNDLQTNSSYNMEQYVGRPKSTLFR